MIARWVLALGLIAGAAHAEKLPADSGVLNITAFGAIPNDGVSDRAAIQAAIYAMAGKDSTIYFPAGVWDSDGPLDWKTSAGAWIARMSFEFEPGVTLRLLPGSAGYENPTAPKSFITTGSLNGSGVEAFQNSINGAGGAIDCRGNPGARCLDYLANNEGTLRDVTILGDGPSCLYLGRAYPGPSLIERVNTDGCKVGIQLGHPQYMTTFLEVSSTNYTVAGMDLAGNAASVDGYYAESSQGVPIVGASPQSYLVLLNAQLHCSSAATSAIQINPSAAYLLRDVTSVGCASALAGQPGAVIAELASLQIGTGSTLNLPNARPPLEYDCQPGDWANVLGYGAGNGVGGESIEDTTGIQAAANSGKPCLYYPRRINGDIGRYTFLGATVSIPRTVQRVVMLGNHHTVASAAYQQTGKCLYRIDEGTADDPPLVIDYFRRAPLQTVYPGNYICVTSRRRVVLRRMTSVLIDASGPGELYALDIVGSISVSGRGRRLYAWQHNMESKTPAGTTFVRNGAEARVIGTKTELDFPVVQCEGGARCEFLGSFTMPCVGQGTAPVASTGWTSIDSELVVSAMQHCGGTTGPATRTYPIAVSTTAGGQTEQITSMELPSQGGNRRVLPLYTSPGSCHL